MKKFNYVITDKQGIHARPAGILAKEVAKYESEITLKHGSSEVNLRKVLAMMSLGVKQGEEVTIIFNGSDEDVAYTKIKEFFEANL